MARIPVKTGYLSGSLPYARLGGGPRPLVVFEGLNFNHKPLSAASARLSTGYLKLLAGEFTVYVVGRRPGLPGGYSMRDMSDDYATMIKEEFGGPVDIMGLSTGGPIAQHFAVDHPELVRRLVLGATGYRLSESGRELQRNLMFFTRQGKWRAGAACLAGGMFSGAARPLFRALFWLLGRVALGSPESPTDGLVELEAEDRHDFRERLAEIKVPTLVIGGERDGFYPVRETAAGIPGARLVLYERAGHGAIMKRRFQEDVLAFLKG